MELYEEINSILKICVNDGKNTIDENVLEIAIPKFEKGIGC